MAKKATRVQLKLLLIGDSSVGKTAILSRYTDNLFSPIYISTIGLNFLFFAISSLDSLYLRIFRNRFQN